MDNSEEEKRYTSITCPPNMFIIRVGDGNNFENSRHPIWGLKSIHKGMVKNIKKGDTIAFLQSKNYGGRILGFAEFVKWDNRIYEPLLSINTYSNEEMGWEGNEDWNIQIHYKNLYISKKVNIQVIIQCGATILNYKTFKDKNQDLPDLYHHYNNLKIYAETKKF